MVIHGDRDSHSAAAKENPYQQQIKPPTELEGVRTQEIVSSHSLEIVAGANVE